MKEKSLHFMKICIIVLFVVTAWCLRGISIFIVLFDVFITPPYRLKSTPLLLAASSGGLSAVKCLISLSADIRRQDSQGNNMVTLAALRFHTNVLEFLIDWNNPGAPVWKVLVSE